MGELLGVVCVEGGGGVWGGAFLFSFSLSGI